LQAIIVRAGIGVRIFLHEVYKTFSIAKMNSKHPIAQLSLSLFFQQYALSLSIHLFNTHNFFGCALIVPLKKDG